MAATGSCISNEQRLPESKEVYDFSCEMFDFLDGYRDEDSVMQVHATLDDVGTREKDGMRAVVGYVAYSSTWKKFNWRWMMTLEQLKKDHLHTAHDLNRFPLIGGLDDEAVCLILAPYIAAVKETLLAEGAVPICVVTECDAYESLTAKEKMFVRPALENSFEMALTQSAKALTSPFHISNAIAIQMDECSDVPALYASYERVKRQSPALKESLGGICFLDDKRHPPVQAADMLGNALLKTWRIGRANGAARPPRVMTELTFKDGSLKLQSLHFDGPALKALAQRRMAAKDKLVP